MSRNNLTYWAASKYWQLTNRTDKNRHQFYAGAKGLRIVTFHGTRPAEFADFQTIAQWCIDNFDIATPEDADALFAGEAYNADHDKLLITFDDGWQSNYQAAKWLAERGIKAIFFIVPSLINRTVAEFEAYHKANGITPYFTIKPDQPNDHENGLTRKQLDSMMQMGHRIAAHNYAHRNLGQLHDHDELVYEIDRSIDAVSQITGQPCLDFAVAFGQPHNLSMEACEYLRQKNLRTYMCFRGLNVPDQTCRFMLRHGFEYSHPKSFTRQAIHGGVDHTVRAQHMDMIRRAGTLSLASQTP
ncbi:MAG TPA: hypothetical protein DCM28_09485 [Phycisphaerales bacterium]|nr:hypothetical protein [Phycisphaerales bacterium]HCD34883.1 hypothetical protein [Phycisphaerales bacterium]|tara:strand:+ start:236 stop:1135 length:900 start_codon:yes stop_codon:yes gene_type:complete